MSLATILVLAAQAVPVAVPTALPTPRGVVVRAVASAEILRAGRAGGEAGPDEVMPQWRRTADGRVLAEFR